MLTAVPPLTSRGAGPRIADRVPTGWDDQPYARFTIQPISPTIGAEIGGISLAEPLDEELHLELNRALLEWKVIFFRDQHLTGAQQAAFARHWGPLEAHPFIKLRTSTQPEDAPEVVRLEKGVNTKGTENIGHSDVTWRECPSLGSVLRAIELPDVGGDTLWSDMGAAYDCLTDEVKERIDGLVAVHDWINTFGRGMDPAKREALRPDFPPIEHPVVRTHPVTGQKALYVNRGFTRRILGLPGDESEAVLHYLYDHMESPLWQCRFRWTERAVAFWDNRCVQHRAMWDYWPHTRSGNRVTVIGDRPV